jgi:hypothetical protein
MRRVWTTEARTKIALDFVVVDPIVEGCVRRHVQVRWRIVTGNA